MERPFDFNIEKKFHLMYYLIISLKNNDRFDDGDEHCVLPKLKERLRITYFPFFVIFNEAHGGLFY